MKPSVLHWLLFGAALILITSGSARAIANPYVESTSPGDGATNVDFEVTFSIEFSQEMDTGCGEATFEPGVGGNGTWEWSEDGTWHNYTGDGFGMGRDYWVNLTGFEDIDGWPLIGDESFTFTVEGPPGPPVVGGTPTDEYVFDDENTNSGNSTDNGGAISPSDVCFCGSVCSLWWLAIIGAALILSGLAKMPIIPVIGPPGQIVIGAVLVGISVIWGV